MESETGLRSMESRHKPITILRCKLLIVGDAWTGKSALTQVFQSGGSTYPKNYLMTVGAEFCVKQIPIPDSNTIVELYIFDCAGQSIFNKYEMNNKYYENASAVMVVYDIGSVESYRNVNNWVAVVRNINNGPSLVGCMVGNKCEYREFIDGSIRAEVVKDDAMKLASELNLKYYETSAANNIDVDEPFKYVANEFYRRYEDNVKSNGTNY